MRASPALLLMLPTATAWSSGMKITHYWDCNGQGCDSTTLQPWNENVYVSPPGYGPQDPNDHGGPLYGEKMWLTGAASDHLAGLMGSDDGCCGADTTSGACGKCIQIRIPSTNAVNSDWTAIVMKKNRCPPWSNGCGASEPHFDIAAPGFDNLQFSTANVCGIRGGTGFDTQQQSAVAGSWYQSYGNTAEASALCDGVPQAFQNGCKLFASWGWKKGDPDDVEYQVVDCPPAFVTHIGKQFTASGPCTSNCGGGPTPPPTPAPPATAEPPATPRPPTTCSDVPSWTSSCGCGWASASSCVNDDDSECNCACCCHGATVFRTTCGYGSSSTGGSSNNGGSTAATPSPPASTSTSSSSTSGTSSSDSCPSPGSGLPDWTNTCGCSWANADQCQSSKDDQSPCWCHCCCSIGGSCGYIGLGSGGSGGSSTGSSGHVSGCTMPAGVTDSEPDKDNTGFVDCHGKLRVDGVQLVDAQGAAIQLLGMSSHGLHWFPNCYSKASITYLVEHWGINLFRAAMYIGENGYASDPGLKDVVKNIVQWCKELGIYVMIDWHVLTPGDPNAATYSDAIPFFQEMATLYKDEPHVLYEIANEPNGVDWPTVKSYHDSVIAAIRAIDANTVILAGTPTWSQEIDKAAANPVAQPENVMYAFHFYAGSHMDLMSRVAQYGDKIPIFATEWGTSNADGNGGPFLQNAKDFLDLFADASGQKISMAQWSYADKSENSAALNSGACGAQNWDDTSCSGTFLKNYIKKHAATCNGAGPVHTQLPTTKAPTTKAPTTKAPTTEAPTTKGPTTKAPTSKAPTTGMPTTKLPTTEGPTTKAPTTKQPTSKAPTTEMPTTKNPTTKQPTSKAPTTKAPVGGGNNNGGSTTTCTVELWGECFTNACCKGGNTCYTQHGANGYKQCRPDGDCPSHWDCEVVSSGGSGGAAQGDCEDLNSQCAESWFSVQGHCGDNYWKQQCPLKCGTCTSNAATQNAEKGPALPYLLTSIGGTICGLIGCGMFAALYMKTKGGSGNKPDQNTDEEQMEQSPGGGISMGKGAGLGDFKDMNANSSATSMPKGKKNVQSTMDI